MKKHVLIFASCFLVLAISLTGCQGINGNGTNELKASGIISATEINIASQVGGTIVAVKVNEGSQVKKAMSFSSWMMPYFKRNATRLLPR